MMMPVPLSLIKHCDDFLVQKGLAATGTFFSNAPPKYAPQYIAAWIMNS